MKRTGAPGGSERAYASFWEAVGATFPSLKGASSTRYYFECERRLHEEFFPSMENLRLLKTDLWDEAKNTEILCWAASRGAHPFGIDISHAIAKEARSAFNGSRAGLVVSDVRAMPFPSDTFDLVYSMGTIEHFQDHGAALDEIFRVMKPSGNAIIGVPNKMDPFLRPLLVAFLYALNLYAYGFERSFTPRRFRRLLEGAGFRVKAQSGILFMPGWLRMLDLWLHTRLPGLAPLTSVFVALFARLYDRFSALRRHGYLLAVVVEKPSPKKGSSS